MPANAQTERVRGGHDAFGVQQRPVDVEDLATAIAIRPGHGKCAIVRNRKSIDVLWMTLTYFFISSSDFGCRWTFGQLSTNTPRQDALKGTASDAVCDRLATGLERGILLWAPLPLRIVIIRVVVD